MKKAILAILAMPSFAFSQVQPSALDTTTINCQSLMNFGAGRYDNDQVIFGMDRSNWTQRELSIINASQSRCYQSAMTTMLAQHRYNTPAQQQLLAQSNLIGNKAREIVERNEDAVEAQKKKDRDDREKVAADQRRQKQQEHEARVAQFNACQETNAYKLYHDQEAVMADIELIAGWKKSQAEEAEISRESGVRDLSRERTEGESIVELRHDLSSSWAEYRKLGGKATSQGAVRHTLQDPCGNLSVQ